MKLTPAALSELHEQRLPDIKVLNMSDKSITSIEDISCCVQMHKLDLSKNLLKTQDSLRGLRYCKELTWINLAHNSLTTIDPLVWQSKLVVLNASHNELISCTETIASMLSLKALVLNHNQIATTPQTQYPPNLNSLILSHNKIESPGFLSSLKDLTKLSLSHNLLRIIPDLTPNSQLKEVSLNSNKISIISNLPPCLEILDLGNNLIREFEDFKAELPNLHSLNLKGNLICSKPAYREQILAMFPKLRILDGERFDSKFVERKKKRMAMKKRRSKQ